MSWLYVQKSGDLFHDGVCHGSGYSGGGDGKNNPDLQAVHCVGPIPCGTWEIRGPPTDSGSHGPYILRLIPHGLTETFGRTGFLLHGDSLKRPGTASLGCIVLPRKLRERIWASGDRVLVVVADDSDAQSSFNAVA